MKVQYNILRFYSLAAVVFELKKFLLIELCIDGTLNNDFMSEAPVNSKLWGFVCSSMCNICRVDECIL